MRLRSFLAIVACKIVRSIMRIMGRGATSFPGKIALKIAPDLLGYLAKDITTVIVTGTNGKTTTSRMIEKTMLDSGLSFFSNKSGANLLHGITTEYVTNATWSGKSKCKYALIESDEAALKSVSRYVNASYILVTNLFRDQLDRFGEITHTLGNIKVGIANSPRAILCLNSDCSMTASLGEKIPNKVIYYGIDVPIYKQRVKEASDAPYCIKCKSEYQYDYITFGHLGKYQCPNCGYARPEPQVAVTHVSVCDSEHSVVNIKTPEGEKETSIHLPGGYNIYNGAASVSMAFAIGLTLETAVNALSSFDCGFGRMEKLMLGDVATRMILIKNPAGCNQVLNFLSNLENEAMFVICLNDNFADGRDISWIWDVDFEQLHLMESKLTRIVISGIRRHDMALRLKYAGVSKDKICVVEGEEELISCITSQESPVYIMPTYTAMMQLRANISKRYGYKDFWE